MNMAKDILQLEDTTPVTLLELRSVPVELALAQTALSRVIEPILVSQNGAQVLVGLDAPRKPAELPWLMITLNGADGALQLPWGVARRLAGVPVENSQPQDAALLVEAGLADWLDEVEAGLGLAIRLVRLESTNPAPGVETTLNLKGKDVSGGFVDMRLAMCLSIEAAEILSTALKRRAVPRSDLPGLNLRLYWECDVLPLTRSDLESLRPGDALTLRDGGDQDRIVLEGQASARSELIETKGGISKLRLSQPFQMFSTFEEYDPMSDQAVTTELEPEIQEQGPEIDDIDLRLSFRVGETSLPLRSLREMGPGSIIEMTEPANTTVSIVVNGKPVGAGELIDVGGRRAVQIRRLFTGS